MPLPRPLAGACAAALLAVAVTGCQSGGPGHSAAAGGAAPAAGGAAAAAAAHWTLSMPAVANGYQQHQPTAAQLTKINDTMAKLTAQLHLTGQTVTGLYDDPAEDAWLIVTGVNGSGFDQGALQTLAKSPAISTDGAGDKFSTTYQSVDPGPHGGSDICQQTLETSPSIYGTLAVEATTCMWLTPTTFGAVYFDNKKDGKIDSHSSAITPDIAGPIMRGIRDSVEQKS
ncbi:hypothetical protein [Kitasatospora kifunensis]|uniref:Lipoprotein n=1 Tax=Kitasatospora kifunensis TaxID=58351 RepID=A0A7W7R5D7_KITKI|nr:hypothetical protein [Kitasatospora kifunensis]MBB4925728.1 hypothetical protein [Kitasatospora kifunensis]